MASDRQIRANRSNAKKSTGPRTLAGKLRSSRNAHKHGLNLPLPPDALAIATRLADVISRCEDGAGAATAQDFSQAHLEVLRARLVRVEMLDELIAAMARLEPTGLMKSIGTIERYERLARQKRRRAVRSLNSKSGR